MTPTVVDAKHVLERVPLVFGFALEIPAGTTLSSATRTCTLKKGVDATPQALLSGNAIVDAVAGEVVQFVQGGVATCRYVIVATATLSNGEILVRGIELPVIDF